MKKKRNLENTLFSFLDVISCGFGAIVMLVLIYKFNPSENIENYEEDNEEYITKINELPQLINVLRGNMSFVGPRPQMKVDFLAYPKDIQKSIYNVVPGITGIGSIFYRDEEKLISSSTNPILFYKNNIVPKKGRLELWYIKNQSFHIDFVLILLTLVVVLHKDSKLTSYFFSRVKL